MGLQPHISKKIVQTLEQQIKINGIYRHYKGNLYKVISLVWQCESDEPERWVVYQGLYSDQALGDFPLFTRRLDAFLGTVLIQGKAIERFAYSHQDV